MNTELHALARQALGNAFYTAFSALVNEYIAASEGLGGDFESNLEGLSNVFSRDLKAFSDPTIDLRAKTEHCFVEVSSLKEALENPELHQILLDGRRIFVRRGQDWYYIG